MRNKLDFLMMFLSGGSWLFPIEYKTGIAATPGAAGGEADMAID